MNDWPNFAAHMLDETWIKNNPPWPIGRVPRDEAEAERRYWPWPLNAEDSQQLELELSAEREISD